MAEAAAWSDELLARLQSQAATLAPYANESDTILDLWQACASGFMAIATLRLEVLDANADPDHIRRGDAFMRVCDRLWTDIAGNLAAGDEHMLKSQQAGLLNTIDPEGVVSMLTRSYRPARGGNQQSA